jgi:hypothetical protein
LADLWAVLGYEDVAASIAQAMHEGSDVNVIEGPAGVGKSRLAEGIGELWEAGKGSAIVARGDRSYSDAALHVLGLAMARLTGGWGMPGRSLAEVTKAGESLAGTAGVITATVQMLTNLRSERRAAHKMFLGDAEQEILFRLKRLSRGRPLLIIADNLHWWDPSSLAFLSRLRDEEMRAAFPFLDETRVLAVQTPEPYQHTAHPDALSRFLRAATTRRFELKRISREGFEDVLVGLGAKPKPTVEVADAVYALSGGHLLLASRCADRFSNGEGDELLLAASSDEFVRRLLSERIEVLGPGGQQVLALLQIAAALGLTFRRDELACAVDGEPSETARLLRYCRDEALLELDEDIGRFVHELYHRYFLGVGALNRVGIHESLSRCLQRLRPGEYELRCRNAVQAECQREAATLAVQAALRRQRESQQWRDLPDRVMDALDKGGMRPVAERFEKALSHLNQYRFTECLEEIGRLPRDLPTRLDAEADYLRATCLMATRSGDDRAHAQVILEAWANYHEEEAELGIRLLLLLLYGLVLLPDKTEGLRHEGEIMRALRSRRQSDISARDALSTLDRCAGSLHGPERALLRVREAVDYYGPSEEGDVLRRPIEYYRCLVNYGALLLLNARYDEAREVHVDLANLIAGYALDTFPRLDYALMNALLVEYRLEAVDPEQASCLQREIVAEHRVAGDPFYVENALACYLTLAGSPGEALTILNRLETGLCSRQNPEVSMLYMIRANRSAVRFVQGDRDTARTEWTELNELVPQIPYVTVPFLIRRHELLSEVMAEDMTMSASQFDECLVRGRPPEFGPFWDQIGRGLWMPEIEWWR